jgi:hypothetical protein
VLIGLVSLIGITTSKGVESKYTDIVDRQEKIVQAVENLERQVDASGLDLGWFALTSNQTCLENLSADKAKADTDVAEILRRPQELMKP